MSGVRRPVGGGEGKRVLDGFSVLLVHRELAALARVPDQDRGAVRGFDAEEVVEVRLVGGEDDVEFGIVEVDPGEVTTIVVLREEGIGAETEEVGERLVVAK